ncbi:DivIVA domain-containing protein [Larkinella terrae]|uniref:DivIVA domain-containing protein n=1 Tax=Larkinella terrae TaxID=2025311 RepID=A0A7K0ESN6_9BACT|nr:DivIVA domain-containing protein [Larkinella terrae]MRS64428.1 DivIVA domain-containing protein [Larkinella terrae]
MKITPIEIRQHTFEKKGFGGYRPDEVDAFLASLSQEWERVTSEGKMLKMQLELAEKELNKFKDIEMTLFKTLKTADDTSSQITDQANKAAEKYLNESKQKADEILADARKRSTLMVQDAENQARFIKENILNDLKSMEHDFKAMEKYKEGLIKQIRTLANNAIDSVDRFEKKFNQQSLQAKIDEVTAQHQEEEPAAAKGTSPADDDSALVDPETLHVETTDDAVENTAEVTETPAAETVEDPVAAQGEEPAEAGFPMTEPVAEKEPEEEDETTEPQAVHEESDAGEKKKGAGSFFDQI